MRQRRFQLVFGCWILFFTIWSSAYAQKGENSGITQVEIPYLKGESKLVYPPDPAGAKGKWYINDHCFVTDKKGVLHFFGINNPYPPKGKKLYRYHPFLGHAITTNPLTKWNRSSNAIDDSSGAEYLGAPFVVWLKQQKRYVMLFESKIDGHRALELAYSDDLHKWQRTGKPVLSHLAEDKRDPFIMQKEDGTFLIYLCTPHPKGSRITVT